MAAWNPETHGTDHVNLVGKVFSAPGRCLASEEKQDLPDEETEPRDGVLGLGGDGEGNEVGTNSSQGFLAPRAIFRLP